MLWIEALQDRGDSSFVEWPYFDPQSPAWVVTAIRDQFFTQALPFKFRKYKEMLIDWNKSDVRRLLYSILLQSILCYYI